MVKDLLNFCLNETLKDNSVLYADIRFLKKKYQQLSVKNDVLAENSSGSVSGIGIRVLSDGAWGFASTNILEKNNLGLLVKKTVKIAKASAIAQKFKVKLAEEPVYKDKWNTEIKINPFTVPVETKIDLLVNATKNADIGNDRIKSRSAFYNAWHEELVFISSEGSSIEQNVIVTGGGVSSIAVENEDMQKRSLPSSFRGNFASSGFEFFENLKMDESAQRASKEAIELLSAKSCPSMNTSVILLPNQLFFQIHESCGHAVELDRALDYEAAYAGTSFLKPNLLKEDYSYGNENVTLVSDATVPLGIGSFGYDHEGVKSQKVTLIDKGKFVGFISSRDTATQVDQKRSTGNMRAESWNNFPLIRISNVNLEPGNWGYDELIEDSKHAIIFDTNKSWSIDDLRLNFQFSSEIGWLVENGEIKEPIKSPNYQGVTPKFWNSCSAVTKNEYWELFGINSCGKGEPAQVMFSGHGSSPTRFDNIEVGIK